MAEMLEKHLREYLLPPDGEPDSAQTDAAEELIEIIHSYLTLNRCEAAADWLNQASR